MLNLLSGGGGGQIVIFAVLLVAIIGLFVWQSISGKKKQKEAQEKVNALKVGDRVKTIGGVCGFVVEINNAENTFVLETGTDTNKSYVKFDKGAIYQTAPAEGSAVAQKAVEEKPAEPFEEEKKEQAPAPKSNKKPRAKKPAAPKEEPAPVEEAVAETVEEVKAEEPAQE